MYRVWIEDNFKKYVAETFKDKDGIKNYLLNHERRHVLFDNLTRQIVRAEFQIFSIGDTQEKKRRIVDNLCVDLNHLFCKTALVDKERKLKGLSKSPPLIIPAAISV